MASSRQVFAMARSGYLPRKLSGVNGRFKTPHWAIVASVVVSFIALFSGKTDQIITLSVMGAVMMYLLSMVSLFVLRAKEPDLSRPFSSPFYPFFPATALVLSALIFGAIIYFDIKDHKGTLTLIFFSGMVLIVSIFMLMGKHKVAIVDDVLLERAEAIVSA